jgi:uncharacterized protein (DUF885 family)
MRLVHVRHAALAAALALAACAEPPPPAAPTAAPATPPPPPTATATAAPEPAKPEAFGALLDRVMDELLADEPQRGRTAGLHDFDARLADTSPAGLAARADRLAKNLAALASVDRPKLSPDEALDLDLVRGAVAFARFRLVDLDEPHHVPMTYEELFAVNAYLDRDYAPIGLRAQRLLAHEKAALAAVPNARANLAGPLSKPVVETAVKIFKGYAEYLRGDVVKLLKGVGDAAFQADLAATNEALAKEADALAGWLEKEKLPAGDASHVLGAARFRELVRLQEGLDVSIDAFEAMGERDLQANKKAYEALAKKAKLTRPKAKDLMPIGETLVRESRSFLVEKKLVTIPSDEPARLKETPPYMRWNAAFLDPPGAFEQAALATYYYLTMPDPSWPKKEQEEYLMPLGVLLSTTIHEVYPGHFLQQQWIRKAPTRAQKLLDSYSFVEGWAHYGEEMMLEHGFGKKDPQNRLGQLSDALLRDCRFVVSVGVHAKGMTLEAAEKRFVDDCKQDKASARENAVRATFDPGYFAYTLGKVQILELREEARKKLGAGFSLQRFHDALLGHGSPPVPLVRDRVLAEIGAK